MISELEGISYTGKAVDITKVIAELYGEYVTVVYKPENVSTDSNMNVSSSPVYSCDSSLVCVILSIPVSVTFTKPVVNSYVFFTSRYNAERPGHNHRSREVSANGNGLDGRNEFAECVGNDSGRQRILSGTSVSGVSGTSGASGVSGVSGTSGVSGVSGTSGVSGVSGASTIGVGKLVLTVTGWTGGTNSLSAWVTIAEGNEYAEKCSSA